MIVLAGVVVRVVIVAVCCDRRGVHDGRSGDRGGAFSARDKNTKKMINKKYKTKPHKKKNSNNNNNNNNNTESNQTESNQTERHVCGRSDKGDKRAVGEWSKGSMQFF